jgi:hypothetical protein
MLESGPSGSVRGVSSNGHPYRDPRWRAAISGFPAGLIGFIPHSGSSRAVLDFLYLVALRRARTPEKI